jgi:hypothetical protein
MKSELSHSQSADRVSTRTELCQLIEVLNQLLVQLVNQLQQLPREAALEFVQLRTDCPEGEEIELFGDPVSARSDMALERLTDIILGSGQPVN